MPDPGINSLHLRVEDSIIVFCMYRWKTETQRLSDLHRVTQAHNW